MRLPIPMFLASASTPLDALNLQDEYEGRAKQVCIADCGELRPED